MSHRIRKILTFAVPAVLLTIGAGVAAWLFLFDVREPEPLVISRETTFVTGPLKPDGSVDFVAAINRHYGEGVRPEDNAAVGLLAAVGTGRLSDEDRRRLYDLLGTAPPDHPAPFVTWLHFQQRVDRLPDAVQKRPWRASEFPLVAGWLETNEDALALVAQAVRKPKFYVPYLVTEPPNESLDFAYYAGYVHGVIRLGKALSVRALLRIARDDLDAAWEDVMTQAALARHVAAKGFLIDWAAGTAGDARLTPCIEALAGSDAFTRRFGAACLDDLELIGPVSGLDETLDWGERLFVLQLATSPDRPWRSGLVGEESERQLTKANVSQSQALRAFNAEMDNLVSILRSPPQARREEAKSLLQQMIALESRFETAEASENHAEVVRQWEATPGKVSLLKALGGHVRGLILNRAVNAEARFQLQRLAMAAGCYRAEHGRPPTGLEDVATYLDGEIPLDPATGKPFGYEVVGDGFRIFSHGLDGEFKEGDEKRFLEVDPVIEVGMPAAPDDPASPSPAAPPPDPAPAPLPQYR